MPLSLSELTTKLDAIEINYRVDKDRVRLNFRTDVYTDRDGDENVHLTIHLEDEGETLRIYAYQAYRLPKEEFPAKLAAVQQTLNQLNWETKLGIYEMDTEDGEIRIGTDFSIEDGTITEKQLKRLVYLVPHLADRDYVSIQAALTHGTALINHEETCRRFDAAMIERDRGMR